MRVTPPCPHKLQKFDLVIPLLVVLTISRQPKRPKHHDTNLPLSIVYKMKQIVINHPFQSEQFRGRIYESWKECCAIDHLRVLSLFIECWESVIAVAILKVGKIRLYSPSSSSPSHYSTATATTPSTSTRFVRKYEAAKRGWGRGRQGGLFFNTQHPPPPSLGKKQKR